MDLMARLDGLRQQRPRLLRSTRKRPQLIASADAVLKLCLSPPPPSWRAHAIDFSLKECGIDYDRDASDTEELAHFGNDSSPVIGRRRIDDLPKLFLYTGNPTSSASVGAGGGGFVGVCCCADAIGVAALSQG